MPLRMVTRQMAMHIAGQYPGLASLNLSNNEIEGMQNLEVLTKLTKIDLSYNNITELNLDELQNHPRLETLVLCGNKIRSVRKGSGFCSLNLHTLDLSHNPIAGYGNLEKLTTIKSLRHLDLSGTPISAMSNYRSIVAQIIPHLQTLDGVEISRAIQSQERGSTFSPEKNLEYMRYMDRLEYMNRKEWVRINTANDTDKSSDDPEMEHSKNQTEKGETKLKHTQLSAATQTLQPMPLQDNSSQADLSSVAPVIASQDTSTQVDITVDQLDIEVSRLKMMEEDLRIRSMQIEKKAAMMSTLEKAKSTTTTQTEDLEPYILTENESQTNAVIIGEETESETETLKSRCRGLELEVDKLKFEYNRAQNEVQESKSVLLELGRVKAERDQALEEKARLQSGSNVQVVELVSSVQSLKKKNVGLEERVSKVELLSKEKDATIKNLELKLVNAEKSNSKLRYSLSKAEDRWRNPTSNIRATRELNPEEKARMQSMEQLMRAQDWIIAREARYTKGERSTKTSNDSSSSDDILAVKLAKKWRSKVFELLIQLNAAKINHVAANGRYDDEINSLNKALNKLKDENAELLVQRNEISGRLQSVQHSLNRAEVDLSSRMDQINVAKRTFKYSTEKILDNMTTQKELQVNLLDVFSAKLERIQKRSANVETKIMQKNLAIQNLNRASIMADATSKELYSLKDKYFKAENTIKELGRSKTVLQKELETSRKNAITALEKAISEMEDENRVTCETLMSQRDEAKRESAALTVSLRQLKRELAKNSEKAERDEHAKTLYMEDKLQRKDKEIYNLRRERNALLSVVRDSEKRSIMNRKNSGKENIPEGNQNSKTSAVIEKDGAADDKLGSSNMKVLEKECKDEVSHEDMSDDSSVSSQSIEDKFQQHKGNDREDELNLKETAAAPKSQKPKPKPKPQESTDIKSKAISINTKVDRLASLAAKLLCDEDDDSEDESI